MDVTNNMTALITVIQANEGMKAGDWITLVAVLVALGIGIASILHTQSLQKRERKERLLNEIIEWAESVGKCGFEIDEDTPNIKAALEARLDFSQSYGFIKAHRAMFQNGYRNIRWRNEYIRNITGKNLLNVLPSVNNLIYELEKHLEMIYNDQIGKDTGKTPGFAQKIAEHSISLDKLTRAVMREAAKIKTENLR